MSDGRSRSKGKRGELDVSHKLVGARRTGHSYLKAPDVEVKDWAVFSVKNYAIGSSTILSELEKLERMSDPKLNRYVVFKARRGVWLIAERLTQHVSDHGKIGVEKGAHEASISESQSQVL